MFIENPILVFDLETNGLDKETLDIIEIACLAIDPYKLTVIPGSEFSSLCRPENIDKVDDTEKKIDVMKISGITKEELRKAPIDKVVLQAFISHVKKIGGKKKVVPAGFNISNFDIPVIDHMCRKFKLAGKDGVNPIFLTSFVMDAKEDINRWFFQSDRMTYTSFDNVRKLMGMSTKHAHRALFDVKQEAFLVVKLLSLYRNVSEKVNFENCASTNGGLIC